MALKATSVAVGTILGTGLISVSGVYGITLTTIKNYLQDDLLSESAEEEEDWKYLQEKLNSSNDTHKYGDASLQAIKREKDSEIQNEDNIKSWCRRQHNLKTNRYFELLNSNILEAVKTFCIRTIGDKLGDQKINSTNDETIYSENVKKLESHIDSNNGNLVGELKRMKETGDKDWRKLKSWCEKTIKEGYNKSDKKENLWKLAQHYCKKS